MQAMSYSQAMEMALPPKSRYAFGSPCRFIPRCDYTCHLLVPALLQAGDVSQQSAWDRGRLFIARRLHMTSPRWGRLARKEQ